MCEFLRFCACFFCVSMPSLIDAVEYDIFYEEALLSFQCYLHIFSHMEATKKLYHTLRKAEVKVVVAAVVV